MRIVEYAILGAVFGSSFNEVRFKSCRNKAPDSAGFFEINFYSHCGNIGTKNVPLAAQFDFETTNLLPVQGLKSGFWDRESNKSGCTFSLATAFVRLSAHMLLERKFMP